MGTKRKSFGLSVLAFVVCAFMAAGVLFAMPFVRASADNVDLGGGVTVNIEGKLGKPIDPSQPAYTGYEKTFTLSGKTYYNLENGYLVGTTNGTTFTLERAYGNIRVKKSGEDLVKDMIDADGDKVAEEFATGADDPSSLIRIYFGGSRDRVKTALKASYRDFLANNPDFNPGIVSSMVKEWNSMLVQDFYLGDSAFNAWAADDGKSEVLGRAHLCSLIYNPNLGKFVMMTDYLKLWDDKKDSAGARTLGYPVTQMFSGVKKVKNSGDENFVEVTDLQIFEKGYMYKEADKAQFVEGKSCADLTVTDEFVFENYLKTEPHRYNEYGTIVTDEVQTAQSIVDRFMTEVADGNGTTKYLYTNYLRGYTKCVYTEKSGVVSLGAPEARAGVWAVKGSDDSDANVTEKYVPMSYEITSFGTDKVDVGMNVSVAHGIDSEAETLYKSYGKTDVEALKAKFVAKYEALRSSADTDPHKMTPGVASDIIKSWTSSGTGSLEVICQDYYDGDSTGTFGGARTNVTVLVYSNRDDVVYAVRDEFVGAYGSRIAALGEPRSDVFTNVTYNSVSGKAQNFRTGALFIAADGAITTVNGMHYNGTAFVEIAVEDTDVLATSFTLEQIKGETSLNSYVKTWTEEDLTAVQNKFLAKYKAMKTDTFNPGLPTINGIRIYRTALGTNNPILCQLYESGTTVDNAVWSETGSGSKVTLALIYNFDDGNVYAVNGKILTKAATLFRGWPAADSATGQQDGNETLFGKGAKYYEFKRGSKAVTVAYTDQGTWIAKASTYQAVSDAKEEEILESVKVEFVDSTLDKKVGDTFKLVVAVTPSGITGVTLCYESDDTSVATVDNEGNVTVVGEGYCTITVYIEGYSKPSDASDKEAAEIWKMKHSECDIDVKPETSKPAGDGKTGGNCNGTIAAGTAIGFGAALVAVAAVLMFAKRRKHD